MFKPVLNGLKVYCLSLHLNASHCLPNFDCISDFDVLNTVRLCGKKCVKHGEASRLLVQLLVRSEAAVYSDQGHAIYSPSTIW